MDAEGVDAMNEETTNEMRSSLPSFNEARIISSTGSRPAEPTAETPDVIELGEATERPCYNGQDV